MAANPLLYRNLYILLGYFNNRDPRFDESLSHTTFNGSSFNEIQGELARRFPNYAYKLDLTASFDAQKFKGFLEEMGNDPSNLQVFYDKLEQAVWNNDWSGLEPEDIGEITDQSAQPLNEAPINPEQVSDIAQKGASPSLPSLGSPAPASGSPRIARQYPFRSGKEGGLGEGTAATNKTIVPKKASILGPDGRPIGSAPGSQLLGADGKPIRQVQISRLAGPDGRPLGRPIARYPAGLSNVTKNMGSQFGIGARKLTTRAPGFLGGFLPQGIGGIFGSGGRNAGGFLNNFSRGRGGFGIPGFGSRGAGRGLLSRGGGFLRSRGGGVVKAARSRWLLWLLLLLLLGGMFFSFLNPPEETKKLSVRVEKKGPDAVANGQPFNYTINVTNTASALADIQVTDTLPAGVEFIEANPKPDSQNGQIVTWNLKSVAPNQLRAITLTAKPTVENVWVKNDVKATNLSTSGGLGTGGGGITGTRNGLLCVNGLDDRLANFFENAGATANVSPSILYAIAMAENGGSVAPYSIDGKQHAISPCGAHGLMQIQHPNDGSGKDYSASCGGTAPETWDGLVTNFNTASGGNLNDADADKDSIYGAGFYVRSRSMDVMASTQSKGYADPLDSEEIKSISVTYLGAFNGSYASVYVNSYRDAFAAQNTCK